MPKEDYSKKESYNRMQRLMIGEPPPSQAKGEVSGNLLSEDESISEITQLMDGTLPGEIFTLPAAVANAVGSAGFVRGWGGGYNLFVNKDAANASDSNSGRDANKPLLTIQQAITNGRAMSGDTIFVLQNDGWQYGSSLSTTITEAVIVTADKPGLTILGVGAGSMGVNWTAGVTGTYCLTVDAIDTVIAGFNFWGDPVDCHGILVEWDGVTTYGENTVIRKCTFSETIDIAIQLEFAWYVEIDDNHFQECDDYGIYVDPAGSGIAYAEITNNRFNDCAFAMALDDCDNAKIENNTIFKATALVTGTSINQGINTSAGSNNMVNGNYFSCLLANYDNFNSASATDAWVANEVINGKPTANPT